MKAVFALIVVILALTPAWSMPVNKSPITPIKAPKLDWCGDCVSLFNDKENIILTWFQVNFMNQALDELENIIVSMLFRLSFLQID